MTTPGGAKALLFALLLDENKEVRIRQLKILQDREPDAVVGLTNKLYTDIVTMDMRTHFPLREIATAEIKSRTPAEIESILKLSRELVLADARVSISETIFMLAVEPELSPQSAHVQQQKYKHVADCADAVKALIVLMTFTGQVGVDAQQNAYNKGLSALGFNLEKVPANTGSISYETFVAALHQARGLTPSAREELLRGLVAVVMADGDASLYELELLRVLAKALECPIPAFA